MNLDPWTLVVCGKWDRFKANSVCPRSRPYGNKLCLAFPTVEACTARWPGISQASAIHAKVARLRTVEFSMFRVYISFRSNYRQKYYDWTENWISVTACNWFVSLDIALILPTDLALKVNRFRRHRATR